MMFLISTKQAEFVAGRSQTQSDFGPKKKLASTLSQYKKPVGGMGFSVFLLCILGYAN